ncbi:MAG: tetratricopeptide repeat protein [Candidatus Melainabacteria bacterium]|nr:tetratricopeptide repeat protein [Candidatus Melainabacteria bacterium]
MGSKKKNTSNSKAGTQPAECAAAPDIELKVAEDVAAEPGDTSPAAETPSAEPPAISIDANSEVSSGADELFAGAKQATEKPIQAPNLSLHASAIPLSLKPEMSVDWPHTRRRQFFNVVYFGLISLQLLGLAYTTDQQWAGLIGSFVCGLLAIGSIFYLFNHRHHQSSSDEFSPRVRRSLRAAALLVPAFLMFAIVKGGSPLFNLPPVDTAPVVVVPPAGVEIANFTFKGEMALGKDAYNRHRYGEAFEHFQRAASLDPQSDLAAEWIAQTYDSTFDFKSAIVMASRAIELNPANEPAHLTLGHGYNMTGRYSEAVPVLQNAIRLDPMDGEAYGYLSRAYSGLRDYSKALIADNSHARIHWYEHRAFEQRADTLDHLGRTAEARYDRELAEKVRQSTRH